ncbi:MAG TPA: TVP38/TMEM64 family protein [Geminicoccaceae bacterium]|nr:TVP38/TMEM64 family protein [Geminicoccaceae bacterium]
MQERGADGRPDRPRRLLLALGVLLALLAATFAAWAFALAGLPAPLPGFELSPGAVEQLIASWGMWAVACSILLMVLHSFVPFPAELVAIANGMLYGPLWGTLITWCGAMSGALLAFGLVRWLGRPFVCGVLGARHRDAVDRWALRQGGGALLLSRFVPVISFNLINYAAGLTAISWWTFTWATGLGILPLTFLMVLTGDRLWTGGLAAWLLLLPTALLGWLLWWALVRQRVPRP